MDTGDLAPAFALADQDGTVVRSDELLAKGPVVLFFYPGAMTPVCTAEACHFRDVAAELADLNAQPVGISADDVAKQKQFADKHAFPFPLLSDADGAVAKAFGVARSIGLLPTKRATFVIGTDGRIVTVVRSELRPNVHADRAIAALRAAAGR
ncbi:MAG TPA: peroxiredoxin [Acidimicrobiales bacterium]|nr:peroxiredoxin [Acidimicrobiales bacterium]